MEEVSKGLFHVFSALSNTAPIEDVVLAFTRQLDSDYRSADNVEFFIFALRSFFCWPRTSEIYGNAAAIKKIRSTWIKENEAAYREWMLSCKDDCEVLQWEKWAFQVKNSIFDKFLEAFAA
jgi:hypothetical protein